MTGFLKRLGHSMVSAFLNFQRDDGMLLSAAVAFYVLLSLGPLLYLLATLLAGLADDGGEMQSRIVDALSPLLPQDAMSGIEGLVRQVRFDRRVAVVAVPGLIWVGSTAFTVLERALNVAFGREPAQRRFWRSRLAGFLAMLVGTLALTAATVLRGIVPLVGAQVRAALGFAPRPGFLEVASGNLAPLIVFTTLLLAYRALPARRVRWSAAAIGAFLATVLWALAAFLFGRLIGTSPAAGIVTGTLAASLSLLLWVYAAIVLSLLGAELAAVWNGDRARPRNP